MDPSSTTSKALKPAAIRATALGNNTKSISSPSSTTLQHPPNVTVDEQARKNAANVQLVNELIIHIGTPSEHPQVKMDSMNHMVKILRFGNYIFQYVPPIRIIRALRSCIQDNSKELRANTYRVMRYLTTNAERIKMVFDSRIDMFMVTSLTRDGRYDIEKEQAFKLIRSIIDVRGGCDLIPQSIIRILVALAEQIDEKYRNISIETLCELTIRRIDLTAPAGAVKVILSSLLEGPKELIPILSKTLLYALDSPATRAYIRPSVELEVIISQFTDTTIRGPTREEKLAPCAQVVIALTKSWAGLLYLCMDNKRAIKSIVDALQLPISENRKILLEMFFAIFQIDMPRWYPEFVAIKTKIGATNDKEKDKDKNLNHGNDNETKSASTKPGSKSATPCLNMQDEYELQAMLTATNSNQASQYIGDNADFIYNVLGNAYGFPISGRFDILTLGEFHRSNLIEQYMGFVLMIFVDSGLLEALLSLMQVENKYVSLRATILVEELLEMCNRMLPIQYSIKIQSLQSLFKSATKFGDEVQRHVATSALSDIEILQRSKERFLPQMMGKYMSSPNSNHTNLLSPLSHFMKRNDSSNFSGGILTSSGYVSKLDKLIYTNKYIDSMKIKLGVNMDESNFKSVMQDIDKQLASSDFSKWNWSQISEFIEGALQNSKRLDDCIKNSKIIKRLLTFYCPSSTQFCDVSRVKSTMKYVSVGCELLKVLLSNSEGIKMLSDNKLLPEIAECLIDLDPMVTGSGSNQLFSRERVDRTLTSEYFCFLGTMTKHPEGIKLLEAFRIYSLFYRLAEFRNREDLIKMMLVNLDYSINTHTRVILSKALCSGSKQIRLFATAQLKRIISSSIDDFSLWGVQLLVTQLYDPSIEVCERAVEILCSACNDKGHLEAVISMNPILDHLGDAGNPLLLRFLSSNVGFEYLQRSHFIEKEMDFWYEIGNIHYVIKIELMLNKALSKAPSDLGVNKPNDPRVSTNILHDLRFTDFVPPGGFEYILYQLSTQNSFGLGPLGIDSAATAKSTPTTRLDKYDFNSVQQDAVIPLHFYGELMKTQAGCQVLEKSGHFHKFAFIIGNWREYENSDILLLKGILWAVGHIGASKYGFEFIVDNNVLPYIIECAQQASVLTLKGLCYYVLGLVSRTPQGAEELDGYGWETVASPSGELDGLCLPKQREIFLEIDNWEYKGSWPISGLSGTTIPPEMRDGLDDTEREIFKCIGNMSNHILANAASKQLAKMRLEKMQYFQSPKVYWNMMEMLHIYHYRLSARRFIQELFERVTFDDAMIEKLIAESNSYSTASQNPSISIDSNYTYTTSNGTTKELKDKNNKKQIQTESKPFNNNIVVTAK